MKLSDYYTDFWYYETLWLLEAAVIIIDFLIITKLPDYLEALWFLGAVLIIMGLHNCYE